MYIKKKKKKKKVGGRHAYSGRRWENGAKDAGGWRWSGGGVLGTKKMIKVGEWWWGRTSSHFLFVVLHVFLGGVCVRVNECDLRLVI